MPGFNNFKINLTTMFMIIFVTKHKSDTKQAKYLYRLLPKSRIQNLQLLDGTELQEFNEQTGCNVWISLLLFDMIRT